jgi:uncharacterized OB-fold protein
MNQNKFLKPLPVPQPESEFYWEKAKQRELWLRSCQDCRQIYFYPRDICPECFSRSTTWIQSSGKGILHTFAIVHRAAYPAFQDDLPYIIAIVELEGGARIPTNLVGIEPDPEKIEVGMTVEVTYDDVSEDITLPKFKPVSE